MKQPILNSWQKKWSIVNDQPNANYHIGKEITYNTEVLKSNLGVCNDAYVLVRGNITIVEIHATQVELKSCAPFTKCITEQMMQKLRFDHANVYFVRIQLKLF